MVNKNRAGTLDGSAQVHSPRGTASAAAKKGTSKKGGGKGKGGKKGGTNKAGGTSRSGAHLPGEDRTQNKP